MSQIQVTLHGTRSEDAIGAYHSRYGYPVEITITRGMFSQTLHLSLSETGEIQNAIQAIREGATSAGGTCWEFHCPMCGQHITDGAPCECGAQS